MIISSIKTVLINCMVFVLSLVIPKSRKIIIIGGWFGKRYSDNSMHLYEYLYANKDDFIEHSVYWVTKSKEIFNKLSEQNRKVVLSGTFKSLWLHLRAKTHIIDQNWDDIDGYFSIRAVRINLWHGFPLKKIKHLIPNRHNNTVQYIMNFRILSPGFWNKSFVVSTSETYKNIFKDAFKVKSNKIIVSSYPRELFIDRESFHSIDVTSILYVPTFRDSKKSIINDETLQLIDDFCTINDIEFLYKPHFVDFEFISFSTYKSIKIIPKEVDINSIFNKTSILITDYSSVYFDFLLTGKPIIFFPYDLNDYISSDRGFTLDYNDLTPGPKVFDLNALFNTIIEIKHNSNEFYTSNEKHYNEIKYRIHKFEQFNIDNITYLIKKGKMK
jgi:CDP-glycerol glycerophosphotransferase